MNYLHFSRVQLLLILTVFKVRLNQSLPNVWKRTQRMRSEQNTSHVQNVLDLFPLNHGQKIKVYSRYMVRAVSDKWSILSTDALKKTSVEQVFIMDIVYWKVHKVQNFYRLLIIFYNSTGGVKKYEESCLDSDRKFLVVSRWSMLWSISGLYWIKTETVL